MTVTSNKQCRILFVHVEQPFCAVSSRLPITAAGVQMWTL